MGLLGTMYDVPLALIGKRVVDVLLVLIELFVKTRKWKMEVNVPY